MAQGESYLFLGPEIGEKHDTIEEIKQRYLNRVYDGAIPATPNIEATHFYAGDTPCADIAAMLLTDSLFADGRFVHIKSIDMLKKNDAEVIAAYVLRPLDNTLLFMTSDEIKAEKSLEAAAGKNKRVFWELSDSQKPQWLRTYWQRQGFALGTDAVDVLLEMVENNTDALRRESSRLMLFLKNGRQSGGDLVPVDAATIEQHLSHTRSESAFTLFSAIAAGDLSKSIEILHALLATPQESPVSILAGLSWSYHKFYHYCKLCEKGLAGNDFELKKLGISNMRAKRDYAQALQNFGPAAAEHFIALTAEFDILLRTEGGALKEVLMDTYLCRILRYRIWNTTG